MSGESATPARRKPVKARKVDGAGLAQRGKRLATKTIDGPVMPRAESPSEGQLLDAGAEQPGQGLEPEVSKHSPELQVDPPTSELPAPGENEQSPESAPSELEQPNGKGTGDKARWPVPSIPDFSSRGRLEASGERISKMTLELPVPVVDRLARWERDYAVRTGERVYRERILDAALASVPTRVSDLVSMARSLPGEYFDAPLEAVGTRVRSSTEARMRVVKPELRAKRIKDVYLRHVYAAAVLRYLDFLEEKVPSKTPRT